MKTRIATATVITAALLAGAASTAARAADPVEAGPDVDAGLNPGVPRPLWELGVGVAGLRLPDYTVPISLGVMFCPCRTSSTAAPG